MEAVMTRETKIGIGIAGVLLTAVGVGVGVKLFRGGGSVEMPRAEPAPVLAATQAPLPAGDTSGSTPPPGDVAAAQPVVAATSAPAPETPNPAPIVVPVIAGGAADAPRATEPPAPSIPLPILPATPPADETKSTPESPPNSGSDSPPMPLPAPVFPSSSDAGGSTNNGTPTPPANDAPKIDSPKKDEPPATPPAIITPPKIEPAKKDDEPSSPAPAVLSVPPLVEARKDADEPAKPAVPKLDVPASPVVITKPADRDTPTVTVAPAGAASAATLGPPGAPLGPLTGSASSRPNREPRVQSYLEEEHHWQPGDSFAAVSQKHYGSDRYAAALQQYNREYPLAGPGLRQNPPVIAPGQVIWVPPVRILERDHANLIADLRPLDDRGLPVRPADPAGQSSGFGAPKLVKVRDRGETMYELARRALGDAGQWHVIHRLNPTLSRDPKLPIPAGTVLRLPPNARLEAGDMP
jgi:hypothetical protein